MSAQAAEAKKKELMFECKYMALHTSCENKVKESTSRLNETRAENKTLTKALERIKAIFNGTDALEIKEELDQCKASLAAATIKMEDLERELSNRETTVFSLGVKIGEIDSMRQVMSWEVDLLQREKRKLSEKLYQTEVSLSEEHSKRQTLEGEVLKLKTEQSAYQIDS